MLGPEIFAASEMGDAEALRELCLIGAPVNWQDNKQRRTPLLAAARHGHEACVKALLAAGADPSLGNEAGTAPLHLAAAAGRLTLLKLLLEAGAPVQLQDNSGNTALDWALLCKQAQAAQLLRVQMQPLQPGCSQCLAQRKQPAAGPALAFFCTVLLLAALLGCDERSGLPSQPRASSAAAAALLLDDVSWAISLQFCPHVMSLVDWLWTDELAAAAIALTLLLWWLLLLVRALRAREWLLALGTLGSVAAMMSAEHLSARAGCGANALERLVLAIATLGCCGLWCVGK